MKKIAKRILSYFMMIVMFVFLFSGVNITNISASERFNTSNGYLEYRVEANNEITIVGYFGTDTKLNIPSEIYGKSVTSIGNRSFYNCKDLISITIPNSVTSIGGYAFSQCTNLKYINIPNSIKKITDRMFQDCSSLKSINIPSSVVSIGYDAFGGCISLENIEIPNSVTNISNSAFANCSSLKSINIPSSVKNIDLYNTFWGCKSLESVNIPNSAKYINNITFYKCTNLTDVYVPDSVEYIGPQAFFGCKNLKSIVIPKSVVSIYYNAFFECDNLNIYGYKDSYAETYAKENSIPFKAINEFYLSSSNNISLKVLDQESKVPIQGATIQYIGKNSITDANGIATIGISNEYGTEVYVLKEGYKTAKVDLSDSFGKMKTVMLSKTSGVSTEVTSNIFNDISLPSEKLKGPEIEIMGKNFNLFETDINLSLNLGDGLQVENDMKEKKIRVMLGMEKSGSFEIKEDENDKSYWRESYYEMKDFVKSFGGKVDNTKLWNKFSKIRGKLKKYDMNLGFGCGGSFTGYAEFSYETGKLVLVEGGAVLNANANLSLNYPFGGICYATFKIQGDIDAGLRLVLEESKGININGEVGLTLIPTFTVGAGIGKVANIDANLEGKLNGMFKFPAKSLRDSFSASLTGSFYITADFLGMEVIKREKTEVSFPTLELYPNFGNVTKANSLSLDDNDFEVVSRDYLKEGTSYTLKGVDNEVYKDTFIKENVYPYGEPQIVTLSNNQKLMVWIDDDEERTNENKTKLVYSLYSNNSWSNPKAVYDDKTADYSPRIAKDGDNVYVIWQNANKVFEEGVNTDEILKSSNISYSKFNGTGFSEQININDISNTKIELMHDISANNGEVSILWVENSSDDIFMVEGKNSIYRRTVKDGVLGSKELLASNIGTISDLDSSYINNKNFVSYSADKDGDISTNGDSEIFIIEDNLISQITDNNVDDTKLQFEGDNLYWNSNGTLKMINVLDKSNIEETGFAGILNDFTILENDTNKFIIYTEKDEGKSEVVASYYNNGEWSDIVPITNYGKYIRKASTVLDNNGQVVMALNVFETDNTGSYQKTDLVVTEAYNNFDLISDEFLTYDESEVKTGNKITLSTNVKNNSLKDVSKLRAKLMDNDNNVLGSYDILEDIKAGETKEISVSYTLPQNLENLNIKLLIESMEYEENNLDNNISKTNFSYSDLSFESSSINNNEISAVIKNNGYDKANNIKVTLYKDSTLGEKIETISIDALDINESKEVNFNIPEEYLVFENSYTNKNFHLEIETSSAEIFTYNNGIDLKIEPTKISEIKLNKNNITLNIGESEKLSAEVFPTDAINKSIIWLSNNIDVATVDNDGNIKSISEGKAEITAISADGEIKSTCYVEVKESLPPIINSFTSDKTSPQVSGNKVSLKVEASGVGELQYKFLIRDSKGNWYVIRNYSSLNTCTWTTGTIGDKTLYVDVKDENGNITRKEMSYKVISEPPIIDSFIPNKLSPQASGTVVTLTAQASGVGELQYKFLIRDSKGNWYVIRNYSSLNTCTWTTGTIGDKTLYVDVKDENGNITRKEMSYKVISEPPIIDSFIPNKLSPQASGTVVTLTAQASGIGKLQYKFLVRDDKGNWYVIRNYSSLNTVAWTTGLAGNKTLYVDVKDGNGQVTRKSIPYTVLYKTKDGVFSYGINNGKINIYKCLDKNKESIVIPSEINGVKVTKINSEAFFECDKVKIIKIPETIEEIGDYAFRVCSSLENIVIPKTVTSIGKGIFRGCENLKSVEILGQIKEIPNETFRSCSSLNSIIMPSSIKTIGNEAFYGCFNLSSITIPSSVSNIGNNAFGFCRNLENITIPELVKNIDVNAFQYCSKLINAKILSELETIKSGTFAGCVNLKSINIPNTVKMIENNAFYNCNNMVIYYYENSYLEQYSKENNIRISKVAKPIIESFKADKVSPQPSNTKITLKAEASGAGTLQYKFLIRDDKGNWYIIRNYSSLNTCTWTTGSIGNKTLYVDVKDSNGQITRKSMTYVIK